jgi:hypothetical protein
MIDDIIEFVDNEDEEGVIIFVAGWTRYCEKFWYETICFYTGFSLFK